MSSIHGFTFRNYGTHSRIFPYKYFSLDRFSGPFRPPISNAGDLGKTDIRCERIFCLRSKASASPQKTDIHYKTGPSWWALFNCKGGTFGIKMSRLSRTRDIMPDITELLPQMRDDDPAATSELIARLYNQLHRLVAAYMRR